MQEMNELTIDGGRELRISVQLRFVLAPVELMRPSGRQITDEWSRLTSAPVRCEVSGPACRVQALIQIMQSVVGNRNLERYDAIVADRALAHGGDRRGHDCGAR